MVEQIKTEKIETEHPIPNTQKVNSPSFQKVEEPLTHTPSKTEESPKKPRSDARKLRQVFAIENGIQKKETEIEEAKKPQELSVNNIMAIYELTSKLYKAIRKTIASERKNKERQDKDWKAKTELRAKISDDAAKEADSFANWTVGHMGLSLAAGPIISGLASCTTPDMLATFIASHQGEINAITKDLGGKLMDHWAGSSGQKTAKETMTADHAKDAQRFELEDHRNTLSQMEGVLEQLKSQSIDLVKSAAAAFKNG